MSITVIIPTYNEEKFIQQAIDSASFADEILVIDSYSTDQTIAIVEQNNCTLFQRKFDNFSNQKNYAIERAQHDWVMILDADELLLPNAQNEIQNAITKEGYVAFQIPRHNFFINTFLAFGSNRKEKLTRVFNRNYCKYKGLVHEQIVYNGNLGTLNNFMFHFTYKNLAHFISKKNKYSDLQSLQLLKKNKKANFFHILIKPLFRFFNELILRRGIFDGVPGLTTTTMNAFGVLSRYIKLRNHQQKTKSEKLISYNAYVGEIIKDAQESGSATDKSPSLFFLIFLPILTFFRFYIFKMYFLKSIDGYALSFLEGFKKYLSLTYRWLSRRNLS